MSLFGQHVSLVVVSPRHHRSKSTLSSMIVRLCVMGSRGIRVFRSQALVGHIPLNALGISRYHLNAICGCKRYTCRSHSLSSVVYSCKYSGSEGITSMYNGNQRDMHTDFKASLRSYKIESTRDIKVSPQCAIKTRERCILLLQSLGGSI